MNTSLLDVNICHLENTGQYDGIILHFYLATVCVHEKLEVTLVIIVNHLYHLKPHSETDPSTIAICTENIR